MPARPERTPVFDDPAFRQFENATLVHLGRYFPRHGRILGDPQMRLVVRDGWRRARRHGFAERRCVRGYIELMCLLGSGFAQDPLLPWAAAAIANREASPEVARADRLHAQAWAYNSRIVADYRDGRGQPTTQRFVEEIKRLRQESQAEVPPAGRAAFAAEVEADLRRVFPAKCRVVGPAAVRAAGARAAARAGRYGITSRRGIKLFAAHLFVLGAAFDRDVLLPWIPAILHGPGTPHERVDRLLAESTKSLRTWWDATER